MSEDDENLQAWIDPELEARVVAAVLGEASAFELAELERIIGEKPELAIFRCRIEAVHGLVASAVKPEAKTRRLSAERRQQLLAALGHEGLSPGAPAPLLIPRPAPRPRWSAAMRALAGLAAVVFVAALLASIALPAIKARRLRKQMESAGESNPKEQFGLGELDRSVARNDKSARLTAQVQPPISPAEPVPAQVEFARPVPAPQMQAGRAYHGELYSGPVAAPANTVSGVADSDHAIARELESDAQTAKSAAIPGLGSSVQAQLRFHLGAVREDAGDIPDLGSSVQAQLLRRPAASWKDEGNADATGVMPASQTATAESQRQLYAPKGEVSVGGGAGFPGGGAAGASDRNAMVSAATAACGDSLATDRSASSAGSTVDAATGPALPAAPSALDGVVAQTQPAVPSAPEMAEEKDYAGSVPFQDSAKALASLFSGNERFAKPSSSTARNGLAAGNFSTFAMAPASAQPIDDDAGQLRGYIQYGAPIASTSASSIPIAGDLPAAATASRQTAMTMGSKAAMLRPPAAKPIGPDPAPDRDEVKADDEPFSTFSLHVGDASFRLAQAVLAQGQVPGPAAIRPEEFYNAFDYGDPGPATGEKISCHIEQCAHPFIQQRNLVRIAMKVAAAGRGQPLRLTVLLDTSGSMEREDRAASVHRAVQVLASLLGPRDAVTLIGFSRQPRLLAEEIPGNQAGRLADVVAHTPSEGGTNLEAAIDLAGELALRHRANGAQNRIVLLTDGAANLGDANPARLGGIVARLRQQGIAFDACGVGAEGYNDEILETLTRKGDGRYYFLNSPEDADAGFARQLAGALRPAAQNVKMQVRFNPARVGAYRLIGFEKSRLRTEDFRNDNVAAAELASEEAAVAVYQVQVLPEGEGELGDVFVRFRDPADGSMVERSWTMSYDSQAPAFDRASPSMELAGAAALLAEKLRGGSAGSAVDLETLAPVINRLRGIYAPQQRVQDLVTMFNQVRRMEGRQ